MILASKLGVTKAALYKHYKSKQEILDSIIEKMKELDIERAKQYEMPEGDLEKVTAEYKEMAFDKIKQYLVSGPLTYMEALFQECWEMQEKPDRQHLILWTYFFTLQHI